MKKKVLLRALLGIPLGIAMSYIITILISITVQGGQYYPCVPSLSETVGSELGAVILQTALSGLLGASFAASSIIWEMEDWSIMKQTGLYFLITAMTMFPVAYFAEWMEHSVAGFLIYFGIFVTIFIVMWIVQYFIWKQKIKGFNKKINS